MATVTSTRNVVPRRVAREANGTWGVTVSNARGSASRRQFYETREQARQAAYNDRVGRNGRLA